MGPKTDNVASLIGQMGLSDSHNQLIYEAFGHSEHINRFIYQKPQAERQLDVTGKTLRQIDEGGLWKTDGLYA